MDKNCYPQEYQIFQYKIEKLTKNFFHSRLSNLISFSRILEILEIIDGIWCFFYELPKFWKKFLQWCPIKLYSPNTKIGKKFYSFKKFDNFFINLMSFPKISEIPGVGRHFQKLLKFIEIFLEWSLTKLCSPNTKSKNWS